MTIEKTENIEDFTSLLRLLKQSQQKLQRKLQKQQEELAEADRSGWYQQIADSLLAALNSIPGKCSSVNIQNIHTQKQETVVLNPKLDIKGNISLFYKKAKKAGRGAEISGKKVEATIEELSQIDELLKECEGIDKTDPSQISGITTKLQNFLGITQSEKRPKEVEKIPYRHFSLDGWDIYVGKNDTQNDELSTRFATPRDLWFHVAGHAGSHVIIRIPKNSPLPPSDVINKTASLAVWFSKAKHTSYAEVHYTEARFVRKRRHAPAGEVIAERCKSIRVSPVSPQDLFPSKFLEEE
jgi:predicted ribosome quality control (RQC) complex YloA/Tae2 family protein